MATLISVAEFRAWAGANVPATVPDALVASCLDEAEAALVAEVGVPLDDIHADAMAESVAVGEVKRRGNRLLARRNSPEGVAGIGTEGIIAIPVRDADSQRAVWQIQALLKVPEGVA